MISLIDVPTAFAAFISAVAAEEILRRWKSSLDEFDEEIEWYQGLRAISMKVKVTAQTTKQRERTVDFYFDNDEYMRNLADSIPYDTEKMAKREFNFNLEDEEDRQVYDMLDEVETDNESFWERWWRYKARSRYFDGLERAGERMSTELDDYLYELNEQMAKKPDVDDELGILATELNNLCHELVVTQTNGLFDGKYSRLIEICVEINKECDERIEELETQKTLSYRVRRPLRGIWERNTESAGLDANEIADYATNIAQNRGTKIDRIIVYGPCLDKDNPDKIDLVLVSDDFDGIDYNNRIRDFVWHWNLDRYPLPDVIPLTPEEYERRKDTDKDEVKKAAETGISVQF